MKREIKFRGMSVHSNKIVTGSLILTPESKYPLIADMYNQYEEGNPVSVWHEVEVYPETVDQFIGKLDINSKELCESDFVLFDFQNGFTKMNGSGKIFYHAESCAFYVGTMYGRKRINEIENIMIVPDRTPVL